MLIKYQDSCLNISPNQLCEFFIGWVNPPTPEVHLKLLRQLAYVVLAIDSDTNKVVGFINAISDGVLSAYLPLLEVSPDYKNRGIGTKLVKKMLNLLKDYYMIDLSCDPELQSFYNKFSMVFSTGMMVRNYKKQNGTAN